MSAWLCTRGSRKASSERGNLGLVIVVAAKGCRSVETQTENEWEFIETFLTEEGSFV